MELFEWTLNAFVDFVRLQVDVTAPTERGEDAATVSSHQSKMTAYEKVLQNRWEREIKRNLSIFTKIALFFSIEFARN